MRRFRSSDRGASLIEVGIILPMLLTLAIGLAEVGFLVIDFITVTNAARSGARTGASAADDPMADDAILDVVEEDLCNLRYGDVAIVQIFRADPSDGSMPNPAGSGLVNSYVANGSLQCDAVGHAFQCAPGPLSCNWNSVNRDNTPPGFDAIGVHIEFTHDYVTNFIPFPTGNFSEDVVMQLEPDTSA
ncbi:MAG: TadE family protein [Acidimicrobiia bacterium]